MTKLKAVDPKSTDPAKPKILLSGIYKVGKTWFALGFPSVYYIDSEKGADRSHYTDRLKAGGGQYMGPEHGTLDADTIIEQFKALATEKHPYKTVVVDSITKIFNHLIGKEQERILEAGKKDEFGASKKPAIAFMRRLIMWTSRLDMNVIFIAHEKTEYGLDARGERTEIGKTADVWEKLPYELDLWLHATKRGPARLLTVKGSRLVGFPDQETFPLEYEDFAIRYGKDVIEKVPVIVVLASEAQVLEIKSLLEKVKVAESELEKVFSKAGVETFEEFTEKQAASTITWLKKKITS